MVQSPKDANEEMDAYCLRMGEKVRKDLGIPLLGKGAVDLTIEASGAPTCTQIGIAVLRPG